MTYSFTLASQPAGGNASGMFSVTQLNDGSGNSYSVLFNEIIATNPNWGLYTYSYCAKNFQTSDYCTQVSITVLPDCSVESVVFYPTAFVTSSSEPGVSEIPPFKVSYTVF
jgi:hypothetical protein